MFTFVFTTKVNIPVAMIENVTYTLAYLTKHMITIGNISSLLPTIT